MAVETDQGLGVIIADDDSAIRAVVGLIIEDTLPGATIIYVANAAEFHQNVTPEVLQRLRGILALVDDSFEGQHLGPGIVEKLEAFQQQTETPIYSVAFSAAAHQATYGKEELRKPCDYGDLVDLLQRFAENPENPSRRN